MTQRPFRDWLVQKSWAQLNKLLPVRNAGPYARTWRAEGKRARTGNALAAPIAGELKRNGQVSAVRFDNMGVLFADIAGFTSFSRTLPPDALALALNQIFSAFDDLVEKYGLEKIRTLGDAYMVVARHRLDSLVQLALDMVVVLRRYNAANGTELAMRIGMHAGPTVAGVIGVKRFLYDVWGDTVTVAGRMQACGEPGAVHVSEAVYLQTRCHFDFSAREPIEVKGRGRMATYWLLGPALQPDPIARQRAKVMEIPPAWRGGAVLKA